jgi:hypothetical protein
MDATRVAATTPVAGFASGHTHEGTANCACVYYLKKVDKQQLHAADIELSSPLLRQLGYTAREDTPQGTCFQYQHSHVWLSPDGALALLGSSYAASRAAWAVLAEHSREVTR